MKWFSEFSLGKLPLWKAFWGFGILGNFVCVFFTSIAIRAVAEKPLFVLVIAAIGFSLSVFIWIGQWRCAFNTEKLFLGGLLRTWLVVLALASIGNVLPYLSETANKALELSISFVVVAAIGYYVLVPVRDFVRLQLFKRKNNDK